MAVYVSGAALSNEWMLSNDGRRDTFRIKDYATGKAAIEALWGEFVRRFSLHILPWHCKRIRYARLLRG